MRRISGLASDGSLVMQKRTRHIPLVNSTEPSSKLTRIVQRGCILFAITKCFTLGQNKLAFSLYGLLF
ncbi:unnamed protein product [Callosobruchus maculatus]|uniref:Uncharacterized protein n=1 Tax=Callosobruchus maculatus TaxID=64391 RepID=A0A653BM67_CALMS|nr:unnamed protein product [Callosobruchus maculatus]